MYWLQFQTRVRKDVTEGADEPTTYFLPTDNLADLFCFEGLGKNFAIRVIVISFTFNEAL